MKAPILSRECFYMKLRDGSLCFLDWNLVQTSIGAMAEPRNLGTNIDDGHDGSGREMYFESFTRITEMDDNLLPRLMGTTGRQLPCDWSS